MSERVMNPAVASSPVNDTAAIAAARAPSASWRHPCGIPPTTSAGPTGDPTRGVSTATGTTFAGPLGGELQARNPIDPAATKAIAATAYIIEDRMAHVALNTVMAIECASPAIIAAPIPPSTHFFPADDAE